MFSGRNRYMFSYEKRRRAELIKRVVLFVIFGLAVIVALFAALSAYSSKLRVTLARDRSIEINTTGTAAQFIEEIKSGELVEDQKIDTSVLGEQRCTVKIEMEDRVHDFTFTVNVVDTEPPVLELGEDRINLIQGASYDVLSSTKTSDNSGGDVEITIEGEFDSELTGEQPVLVVATDASGNRSEEEVVLNVIEISENMEDMSFLTGTGYTGEIRDGMLYIEDRLIVNRSFGVPMDYAPGVSGDAEAAFNRMAAQSWNQGIYLVINRSFRSYEDQAQAFDYFAVGLGEGENTTSSIKAGHSEHQTGLAFDVNASSGYFSETPEAKWLKDNCQKYGFILRYPEGKEKITGCAYEPWHIRYVGEDLAEKLYNGGDWITLEEYYGIPSEYTNKG